MPRRAPRRRRVGGCSPATRLLTSRGRRRSAPVAADRGGECADVRRRVRPRARGAGRGERAVPEERVPERAELVTKIVFARRMGGRPLESRDVDRRDGRGAAGGQPRGSLPDAGARARPLLARRVPADVRVAHDVLTLARGHGEQLVTSWAAGLCSVSSTSLGRPADGLAELREAKAAIRRSQRRQLAEYIDVAGYVAQAAALLEQTDIALECATRGLQLAEMTGQGPYIPASSCCRRTRCS